MTTFFNSIKVKILIFNAIEILKKESFDLAILFWSISQ